VNAEDVRHESRFFPSKDDGENPKDLADLMTLVGETCGARKSGHTGPYSLMTGKRLADGTQRVVILRQRIERYVVALRERTIRFYGKKSGGGAADSESCAELCD